jgi:hypothetical protein
MIFNFYIIQTNHISKTFRDPLQVGSRPTSLGNAGIDDLYKIKYAMQQDSMIQDHMLDLAFH